MKFPDKLTKSKITFIIFTYNEEKRIQYPIKCFLPYGPVLVVDNFSNDKTVEISQKAGAEVIRYKNNGWVETKKEADFVYRYIKTDWVFWGFADEMVPKTCLELYKKISSVSKYKIVIQKRKTLLYDSNSEFVPCYVSINFFRKDAIDFFSNAIHQMGKFTSHVKPSEILYLPPVDEYSVYHFSRYNTESVIRNFNSYSSLHAQSTPKKFIGLKIIFSPIYSFFLNYIFFGAFKYGLKGLIISIQFAIYSFLTLAKVYEKSQNITLDSIEEKFVLEKEKILKQTPKTPLFRVILAKIEIALISRLHKYYKFRQIKDS